ncbi:MAG: hypothetical protein ACYC0B_03230 [Gemmatimonadaceae bacterium]
MRSAQRNSAVLVLVLALALVSTASRVAAQQEPPRRLDFGSSTDTTTAVRAERRAPIDRGVRNAFVRDQTILGLAVYGPSFAAMVGDNGVTASAGYLVMAGGTFFAAAEAGRRLEISEAQQLLSTRMAWRGAISALYIASSGEGSSNASTNGAATLIGGLGGTVAGMLVGNGLTPGEAVATTFGHDLAFASAAALAYAADPEINDDRGISDQSRAILLTVSGWTGYALGRLYAGNAPYNVTAGDVQSLWLGAAIGATAAGTAIVESEPSDKTVAVAMLGGGLLGTWAADRLLVRRFDHTRSEGNMLALGGVAGGLMGVGVGVLVAGEAEREGAITLGFATLGAIGGVVMTERYLQPRGDEGRRLGLGQLTIDPVGLASAAAGAPGRHPLLRFTF